MVAEALKLTAQDLLEQGVIDEVVEEPVGGAHRDPAAATAILKEHILNNLATLKEVEPGQLIENRIEKYGKMGFYDKHPYQEK